MVFPLSAYASGNSKKYNPIQKGVSTNHNTAFHTEYGTGWRGVGDLTVTMPDGTTTTMSMDEAYEDPKFRSLVSDTELRKYKEIKY